MLSLMANYVLVVTHLSHSVHASFASIE